jgi:hypothetical protein
MMQKLIRFTDSKLHFVILLAALFQGYLLNAAISGSDDFNDNVKDAAKWGADIVYGNGVLTETSQRLQYTVSAPTPGDDDNSYRPWILNQATYDADWEVVLDLHNTVTPTVLGQVATVGIEVFNASDLGESVYVEMYASSLDMFPPYRRGFKTAVSTNSAEIYFMDTMDLGVTDGAIRILFNSQTKVLSVYYHVGGSAASGYVWTQLAGFGINTIVGANNVEWGMSGSQPFQVAIYGFSTAMTVSSGQVYADNFSAATAASQAPLLSSVRLAGTNVLSWPQTAVGYNLVQATNLISATWSNVAQSVALSNGVYSTKVPITGSYRFFRLRKP